MSLPILGLRVRLKGEASSRWELRLSAAFTDGSRLGPVKGEEDALEADSLAPLEAFCLELHPIEGGADVPKPDKEEAPSGAGKSVKPVRKTERRRTRRR